MVFKKMKYIQCRVCKFWVRNKDRFCPDCGYKDPYKPKSKIWTLLLMGVNLLIHFSVLIFSLVSPYYRIKANEFLISLVSTFIVTGGAGIILDRKRKSDQIIAKKYLKSDEKNINRRLNKIVAKLKKLANVRNNIKAGKRTEKMKSMLDLIKNAENLMNKYKARYEVELCKIDIIRWKNTLEPIEFEWQKLDYHGCNDRIGKLKEVITLGTDYKKDYSAKNISKTKEGKAVLQYLNNALKVCDRFFEGLTARQAKLAINDVSPAEEQAHELKTDLDDKGYKALFNVRKDVSAFVAAFAELETEFDRLEAEDKLTINIKNT